MAHYKFLCESKGLVLFGRIMPQGINILKVRPEQEANPQKKAEIDKLIEEGKLQKVE